MWYYGRRIRIEPDWNVKEDWYDLNITDQKH